MNCQVCTTQLAADQKTCPKCGHDTTLPPIYKSAMLAATGLRTGDIVGERFRIDVLIGQGGMGQVYRAHDLALNEDVAIKALYRAPGGDGPLPGDIRKEITTTRALSHPNVIKIYDFHQFADLSFITMEFVDGESLAHKLAARGSFPVAEAVDLGRQICDGLEYAHAHHVVHQDIKPANLIIDRRGTLKIADFGIARLLTEQRSGMTGVAVGTPAYMSPEQIQGLRADPRTDLYSLGVVLWELATGSPPFTGEATPYQHLNVQPAAPADMHPLLERVLRKALAKRPEERFQTASEMLSALRQVQETTRSTASPATPAGVPNQVPHSAFFSETLVVPPQASRSRWRLPLVAAATGLVLVVGLAGVRWYNTLSSAGVSPKTPSGPQQPGNGGDMPHGSGPPGGAGASGGGGVPPLSPGGEGPPPANDQTGGSLSGLVPPPIKPAVSERAQEREASSVQRAARATAPAALPAKADAPVQVSPPPPAEVLAPTPQPQPQPPQLAKVFPSEEEERLRSEREARARRDEALGALTKRRSKPRAMVIITEEMRGGAAADGGAISTVETVFMKYLLERGFQVMDKAQVATVAARDQVLAAAAGDSRAGAVLGQQLGADLVITGKSLVVDSGPVMGSTLHILYPEITVRALRAATGEVIAIESLDRKDKTLQVPHAVPLQGATMALEKGAERLAARMIDRVAATWAGELGTATAVSLKLTGLSSREDLDRFVTVLASEIEGVRDVRQREFAVPAAIVDLEVSGGVEQLASRLQGAAVGRASAAVTGTTADSITVELRK